MRNKLHKLVASALLAGVAALLLAPSAEANRGPTTTTTTRPSYVPPQAGENPTVDVGGGTVEPAIVPVDLGGVAPVVTDPGAGDAGDGDRLAPAPADTPIVLGAVAHPKTEAPSSRGGILSRTGAETMPLARVGLAALALGAGLVMLARRRPDLISA